MTCVYQGMLELDMKKNVHFYDDVKAFGVDKFVFLAKVLSAVSWALAYHSLTMNPGAIPLFVATEPPGEASTLECTQTLHTAPESWLLDETAAILE